MARKSHTDGITNGIPKVTKKITELSDIMVVMKVYMNPATKAENMIGKMILKKMVIKSAPKSAEASSISMLIWCNLLIPASTPTARNRKTQLSTTIKTVPVNRKGGRLKAMM